MQNDGLSIEDGLEMRRLLAFPGGLELHIGVMTSWSMSSIMPTVPPTDTDFLERSTADVHPLHYVSSR